MKKLNILFLGTDDWANVGYEFAESIKSIGHIASMKVKTPHGFNYTKQGDIIEWSTTNIKPFAEIADCIIFMHTDYMDTGVDLNKKGVGVFHGGTRWRSYTSKFAPIFNPIVDFSLTQTEEMMGLGAKNEIWMIPPIDTNTIQPNFNPASSDGKRIIAHYPRKPEDKGTALVLPVLDKLQKDSNINRLFEFKYSHEWVDWPLSLKRMSECDIYIESMILTYKGRKHGAWGITALESTSLGKITVTNFLAISRYQQEYKNRCALHVANSQSELERILRILIKTDDEKLMKHRMANREWVVKNHSYKPTGIRLMKKAILPSLLRKKIINVDEYAQYLKELDRIII